MNVPHVTQLSCKPKDLAVRAAKQPRSHLTLFQSGLNLISISPWVHLKLAARRKFSCKKKNQHPNFIHHPPSRPVRSCVVQSWEPEWVTARTGATGGGRSRKQARRGDGGNCWREGQGSFLRILPPLTEVGLCWFLWRDEALLLLLLHLTSAFFLKEQKAAQYCSAVICKQACFHKCPTGIRVLIMLPFCPLLLVNPRVGHSSAPPSRSAQLLTWSVSKHRAVNA